MHLALGSRQLDLDTRAAVVGLVEPALAAVDAQRRTAELCAAGADIVWLRRSTPASMTDLVASVVDAIGCPVGVDAVDHADIDALADAGATLVGLAAHRPDALAAAEARGLCVYLDATPGTGVGLDRSRLVVEGHLDDATALHGCTVRGTGPATWARVVLALRDGARVVRTFDVHAVRRVAAVTARLLDAREGVAGGRP